MNKNKYRAFILGGMYEVRGLRFHEDGVTVITDGGFYTISNGVEDEDGHLMQSTGLFDKNGVEIFEGDIVRIFNQLDKVVFEGIIVYNQFDGCFELEIEDDEREVLWYPRNRFEVIGNIHEKPKTSD